MVADVQDDNSKSARVFEGVQNGKLNSVGVFVPVQSVPLNFIYGFAVQLEGVRISGERFAGIKQQ